MPNLGGNETAVPFPSSHGRLLNDAGGAGVVPLFSSNPAPVSRSTIQTCFAAVSIAADPDGAKIAAASGAAGRMTGPVPPVGAPATASPYRIPEM